MALQHNDPPLTLPPADCFLVKGPAKCDLRRFGSSGPPLPIYSRLVMGSASRRPPLREPIRKSSSMQPLNEKISIIPPRRDNHVHQKGDDQPCGFSKKLPENRAWRPFTLSYAERFKPNLCPAILFPSTFALRGLSRFPVQNCKYNRPKGNYVAYTLPTFKDNLKSELYPDPVMGASRSFLQRMSELSSLEEETAWEEKLKKMRLSRKASPS